MTIQQKLLRQEVKRHGINREKNHQNSSEGITKKLEIENKDISDQNKINQKIHKFFKNVFAKSLQKSLPKVNNSIEKIIVPVLNQEQKQNCEKEISKKELIDAVKDFNNNKSP